MENAESNDEKGNDENANDIQWQDSKESCEDENVAEADNTPTFDFTERSWRTDLALVVEGTRLYVAKNILSLASPVFDRMFESSFKESSSNEIELPGKKLCDVIDFLRCIYPNTFTLLSCDTAMNILPLIEEYQVMQLKPRCEAVMLESINAETPVEELFQFLKVACMYNLKKLRDECVTQASKKSQDELDKVFSKCTPPAEGLNEILVIINRKLRAKVDELVASNRDILQQNENSISKLHEANLDVEEELKVMKQYLTAEMRRTKDVKLDAELNWKEVHVVSLLDIATKGMQTDKNVTLWNIPFTITVSISKRDNDIFESLYVDIKNMRKKKLFCKYRARFILVNRQPNGLNEFFSIEGSLFKLNQSVSKSLKTKYEIVDVSKGFVNEGKISVITQLYMSEPNQA